MTKIFRSLMILAAIGSIAGVATYSYFSDTETSTGNTFAAGSLDLKIDHKKMVYNDEECEETCTENTGTNLIENGSFENPDVTNAAKWEIFPNGTSGLEWTVEWESTQTSYNSQSSPDPALVEYHEGVISGWDAFQGDQYTELDADWFGPNNSLDGEPALVKIYQDVPTVSGQKYIIHYAYSPRPDVTNAADNELKVRINGIEVDNHSQAGNGSTTSWTVYDEEFTASGATTRIEFAAGGTANSLGVFLDDVKVYSMDCTYKLDGEDCKLWTEKDLGEGDIFWNFSDVKPGDQGVNVISIDPYDNNAWVCMRTANEEDLENTRIDPETEAGDVTPGTGITDGELSKFLKVFTWWDDDANGSYDSGETAIKTTDFGSLGTIALADSVYSPAMTGGVTKNVGVYWCAGTMATPAHDTAFQCDPAGMDNTAQTDIYTTDIEFYAEQERNNDNFKCSDWR